MTDQPEDRREAFERTWEPARGFPQVLTEVNNQVLGRWFMITAGVFFVLGGLLAILLRTQLASSDLELVRPELFNQLFTMHGSTMMYLFAVPFLEGLAIYLVPPMIGSRDLAFPRLTAFGFWTYLAGGLLFYSSWIVGAVPDAGWFAYTPLSGPGFSAAGQDLWLVGLALVEVAGITFAIEIGATILLLRAPGMSLDRMPVFVWTVLVTALMMLFAFTVLLTATLLLELDRTAGTQFFDPSAGGSSLLWQHLFWFFGHPEVYIAFLPATGIVSSLVPVIARRPLVAYELVVASVILIGFVSFGLWVHHMFVAGWPELSKAFFTAASLLIAVASGTQIFAWVATLWGTRPRFEPHLLFLGGFFFVFTLGGMTGVMVASVPFDTQVHDTYFVVAHLHYVLIGGVVFPILAGIHFWAPRLLGRRLDDRLSTASFWLVFISFNATFFPMHIMGYLGMPRRVYTFPAALGLDGSNLFSTLSAYVLGLGFLVFIGNLVWSARRGEVVGEAPWRVDGLEWSGGIPAPSYGFRAPPRVNGRHALWNEDLPLDAPAERAREALDTAPHGWRGTLITDPVSAAPVAILALPGPDPVAILTALALTVVGIGVLVKSPLIALAALAATVAGVIRWLSPDRVLFGSVRVSPLGEGGGLDLFPTGPRAVQWWGALGTAVAIGMGLLSVLAAYAYLWLEAGQWPPVGFELPPLGGWAVPYGLLVVAAPPTRWAWRAHHPDAPSPTRRRLAVPIALGLVAAGLRVGLLAALPFDWTPHAFASAFWTVEVGFLLVEFAFLGLAFGTAVAAGAKEARATPLQLEVLWMFWAFQALLGVLIFGVVHVAPRLIGGAP